MSKPNGVVVYHGPSAIDGEPIVVILVGLESKSTNAKTGGMIQTYILRDDLPPVEVAKRGLDGSVCGDCPHRSKAAGGQGSCYVNLGHGPRSVFAAWKRGNYPWAGLAIASALVAERSRGLRIGTYGDPGAVPDAGEFWGTLAAGATFRTGYTHRWGDTGASLAGLCQASVDSIEDARKAWAKGFSTFRVAPEGDAHRERGEARCPASAEAGKRVKCETCPILCNGTRAGAIVGRVIQAHGATRKGVKATN